MADSDLNSNDQGFLLREDNDPKKPIKKRINDYHAGKEVAKKLREKLCYDSSSKCWGRWVGTHWHMSPDPSDAIHKIAKTVAEGCEPIGYSQRYRNAISQQIEEHRHLQRPELATGVVPFENGLLEIESGTLRPAIPESATDFILPHKFDVKAVCPTIKHWLLESVEGDEGTVEVLRAFLSALIRGMPLQKFLLLIGPGGTSKGTFQRLMVALAGELNTETSTLANLENNRFEPAKHYGKRLCLINEAGKFGGQLNMLKAMTGGDHLPMERKNQQQYGTFKYDGLVLMATNDEISSSDSGLERRRITIRFNRVVTTERQEEWRKKGGETSVLHKEIPGLILWLLELSEADIHDRLHQLPERIKAANVLGMRAGSSVADWVHEECDFEPGSESEIGLYKPDDHMTHNKLYPAYRIWCEATGRKHPLAQNKFKANLIEVAATLGHELTERQDGTTRRTLIVGLKLQKVISAKVASVASSGFENSTNTGEFEAAEGTEGILSKKTFQNNCGELPSAIDSTPPNSGPAPKMTFPKEFQDSKALN